MKTRLFLTIVGTLTALFVGSFITFFVAPYRIFYIFAGFTFTDAEDFGPVLTLLAGAMTAFHLHRSPRKKMSVPLAAWMSMLSFWPLLPNFSLYLMAREFQAVRGGWPQVMINDPKWLLGHVSPRFDTYYHSTAYLEAYSGACMVVFFCLFFAAKASFSRTQRWLFISLMLFCLVVASGDPGNLYAWWLD